MKKFINEVKSLADPKDHHADHPTLPPQPHEPSAQGQFHLAPPTQLDLYRYRYQNGTNLGSVFCLESWLTGSMFPKGAGPSELDAATASVQEHGIEDARKKFEHHWHDYVTDADLDWLSKEAKCNSVRLPVGYWTLGPSFCRNTPFEHVAGVYENAWTAVMHLIARCRARHIGVLVDLHGVPGGINGSAHSGTSSGRAELWSNPAHQDQVIACLEIIAHALRDQENIIGMEVCNEADWAPSLWAWYDRAIAAVHKIDPELPIYLSDGWRLPDALNETAQRNSPATNLNPLIVDTHLYYCFSPSDTAKPPSDLIAAAGSALSSVPKQAGDVLSRGATAVAVGEYSSVLSEPSWSHVPASARPDLIRTFTQTQCATNHSRAAGAFFWTARMDWMPGGEWGFRAQVENKNLVAPSWLTLSVEEVKARIARAHEQAPGKRSETYAAHCGYWDQRGGQYDHSLFAAGWDAGFADALRLFGMRSETGLVGGDRIGSVDMWVLKRLRDAKVAGNRSAWEFEHGLRQGVRDFYGLVGVE
ncbi:hypothetical protein ANO11243_083180 [Dothideomycetidae sp. 11243]|nr:hypothetical protein ANO11243_083180 [fungal sp. No.11243]